MRRGGVPARSGGFRRAQRGLLRRRVRRVRGLRLMQPQHGCEPTARLDGCELSAVAQVAAACGLCRLSNTRTSVVFGQGPDSCRLMFVGEAPGYHEDRSGNPLVGPAGELFDDLLHSIGMQRSQVYVTSVVKCRPPRNRTPFPDEIEQCEAYLFRQVTLVSPDVICTLGNVAIRLLTGRPHRMSHVHGAVFEVIVQGRPVSVVPLYHPAAVLHDPMLLETLRGDLRRVDRLLRGEDAHVPAADVPAPAGPVGADDQLTLNLG